MTRNVLKWESDWQNISAVYVILKPTLFLHTNTQSCYTSYIKIGIKFSLLVMYTIK